MSAIPMVFHFTYYRGSKDWRWTDIHTLCLKSCQAMTGATKLVVHYDREDSGVDWDAARALANVEWRQREFAASINGHPVTDQRLVHDLHRLRTLWEEGGWYCDLDFVFLKSMEILRHNAAVIGTQCKQKSKLNCALIGAVPGSAFIGAYLEKYMSWTPDLEKTFWIPANNWPWELSQKFHTQCTVLPRPAFYAVAWSNKSFWKGGKTCLRNAYALHLWETLRPGMTVEDLRKTVLSDHLRNLDGETQSGVARLLPGVTLVWD
jgi:hypothetical protein